MSKKTSTSDNVRVCCRVRPLNKLEESKSKDSCILCSPNKDNLTCLVKNSVSDVPEKHPFTFSEVFTQASTQDMVYNSVGRPAVVDVMDGYNATVFMYGQTGSGKTHTMFGKGSAGSASTVRQSVDRKKKSRSSKNVKTEEGEGQEEHVDPEGEEPWAEGTLTSVSVLSDSDTGKSLPTLTEKSYKDMGIIPRAVDDIFRMIMEESAATEFQVRLFFVEVYMEQVRDLLSPVPLEKQRKMGLREDVEKNSFYIEGCENPYVTSPQEVMQLINRGIKRRATSSTTMNETSSRSHCIMNLTVKSVNQEKHESKMGKLFLVDLAGSEKVGKTNASGMRLEEAKLINKSLTTLGLVINSLTDNSPHVPYRDSVLTKILKDSLGGNSKTSLVICCSPSMYNAAETLSTLRFGARAKNIRNAAVVNKELTVAELTNLLSLAKAEIQRLEKKIQEGSGESPSTRRRPDNPGQVDALLAARAEEKVRVDALKSEVGQLQDDLNAVNEINAALTEQREEQRVSINLLTEEILIWEDEYNRMKQCVHSRDMGMEELKSIKARQAQEIQLLISQMEEYITPLEVARASAEEIMARGMNMAGITPQRRRTIMALEQCATGPLFPSRSRSGVMTQGDQSLLQETVNRAPSETLDVGRSVSAPPAQLGTAPPVTHLDAFTNSPRPSPPNPEQQQSFQSPPPLMVDRLEESGEENLLSAAAAQRITELEKNVEDMEAEFNELRRDYSQCKMDLQLAEKRLTFRQERIEFLKASLQNESQKSVDLSQTLEREREGQRGLLQKARNDASYYRKRYEDLQRKMQNQAPKSRAGSYVENTHHEADDDELDSQLSIECSSPGFNLFKSILGGRK